ncbi:hypothetical protein CHCC15325_3660 [Bacillus licheniformis]|uniref:Uncharacterized protein n=1 Tax=Bacillus licheniformis TaxID=1402 RepID=A0A8B5Y987_BACLI|nr:hypothetical protein B4092_2937 [Bacillus licheniformis]KYC80992.1 hypothetical protein B4091_3011 [Bacillus licheniformis]KYC96419.1 hypothetical protein B4164_2864 [Bacillus licheniformis]OLF90538.1 hypothetical protein B4089_2863 [Bacillus licheniformis]OLF91999.1 hypothetical protein B4094_2776 [Bacillus licheniformis]
MFFLCFLFVYLSGGEGKAEEDEEEVKFIHCVSVLIIQKM